MSDTCPTVFISYSRLDAMLVAPVVALLRASRVIVFRDADSIAPGKRWREEIESAIRKAKLIVVFCCNHSYSSFEVVWEYRLAMELGKDVLPLRLDGTPVPADLQAYQMIDFREFIGTRHGGMLSSHRDAATTEAPRASIYRWLKSTILDTWHRWIGRGDEHDAPACCLPHDPTATQSQQQMAQIVEDAVLRRMGIRTQLGG